MTANEITDIINSMSSKQKKAVKKLILEAMGVQRVASVCGNSWAVQAVKEIREICKN